MSEDIEFVPGRDPNKGACNRLLAEWVKAWHRWYLGIPEDRHPTLPQYSNERRQDQEQNNRSIMGLTASDKCNEWVWFLAGGYGGSIATRSFIPPGNFCILAPVYVGWASEAEYPSLNSTNKLNKHLDEDVEYLELIATLDGNNVPIHHIKIDKPFKATLPSNNILGIPAAGATNVKTKAGKGKGTSKVGKGKGQEDIVTTEIELVSDGHWIWLNPLPIGEHRLHLYGYSSHYAAELNATLSVAGPRV
jgi:hypothetical protein